MIVPKPEDSEKRAYKYPFLTTELLSFDVKEITDLFFLPKPPTDKTESIQENVSGPQSFPLLEKLLSLLNTEEEPNPVLMGYFYTVLGAIIDSKKSDLWKYHSTSAFTPTPVTRLCTFL